MSQTENPSKEEITTETPPTSLVARIEELEDLVYDLQQQVEDLQRNNRQSEMHSRFDGNY